MSENNPKGLTQWNWILSFIIASFYIFNLSSNTTVGLSMLTNPSTEFNDFFAYTVNRFGTHFLVVFVISIVIMKILKSLKK